MPQPMSPTKKILVTGGSGYIGSHTAVQLLEAGYEVVILDNLSNSSSDTLAGIEKITGIRPYKAILKVRVNGNYIGVLC